MEHLKVKIQLEPGEIHAGNAVSVVDLRGKLRQAQKEFIRE